MKKSVPESIKFLAARYLNATINCYGIYFSFYKSRNNFSFQNAFDILYLYMTTKHSKCKIYIWKFGLFTM